MSEIINENNNKKARLGRGLGSLLSQGTTILEKEADGAQHQTLRAPVAPVDNESRVWQIDISKIRTSKFQPRNHFEKAQLEELAQSIRENGIIQPIVVRKNIDNSFEIVAGERRWRAAQLAGKREVPAIIKALSDKEALEVAIIENVQRENLNPIEEAEAYQRLIEEFALTQNQVAEKVGKDRVTVTNAIRVLTLPSDIKIHIKEGRLSLGHAKVLLSVENQQELKGLADLIIKDSLSVRKLEKIIKSNFQFKNEGQKKSQEFLDREIMAKKAVEKIAQDLQTKLGTKVQIDYENKKGKIQIFFYSDEELTDLAARIKD